MNTIPNYKPRLSILKLLMKKIHYIIICSVLFFGVGYCASLMRSGKRCYSSSGSITTKSALSDAELETIQIISSDHDDNFERAALKLEELQITHYDGSAINAKELKESTTSTISSSSYVVYVNFRNEDSTIVKDALDAILKSSIETCETFDNLSEKVFILSSPTSVVEVRENQVSPLKTGAIFAGIGTATFLVLIVLIYYYLDLTLDYDDLLDYDVKVYCDLTSTQKRISRILNQYLTNQKANINNNYRTFLRRAAKESKNKKLDIIQIIPSCSYKNLDFSFFLKMFLSQLKFVSGENVCIVDFDFQHQIIGKCLTKSKFIDLKAFVDNTQKEENLDQLTVFTCPANSSLTSFYNDQFLSKTIQKLKKHFETIILVNSNTTFCESYTYIKQYVNLNIVLAKVNITKKKTVVNIVNNLNSENYIVKFL